MSNEQTFKLKINGKEYEVIVGDVTHDPVRIQVNGQPFVVELSAAAELSPSRPTTVPAKRSAPAVDTSPSLSGGPVASVGSAAARSIPTDTSVLAPMPGSIMNIRVKSGQRVQEGDVLCYLEAMKMHNPIHAPMAGVIEEVTVTEGQAVVYRQVLIKYAG